MPEQPEVMADPFAGGEPTFEEFSKYRESGEIPERFKSKEAPAAEEKSDAKPQEGKEPSKEAEQEKKEPQRDEQGKFKKVEFSAEQQDVFDREFRKKEAKLRREYEARIAEISKQRETAPTKQPVAATAPPNEEPKLPKLSEFAGTVEEFEKEVAEFPAKHAAWVDAQRTQSERTNSVKQKLTESEARAHKNHPDYKDEFEALTRDIQADEEPKLPDHVLRTIAEETDDPHELSYYLAKNRDEFRRLAALKPHEALREVLKLEAKIAYSSKAPAQVEKPKPQKPRPPEPVGGRQASGAFDVNDDATDGDAWLQERNKQIAARRR